MLLKNKRALIIGLMSNRSIAYGIAESFHQHGALQGFSCMERFLGRVDQLSAEWSPLMVKSCDVSKDEDLDQLATFVKQHMGHIDVLVHSIAFAPRDHLEGQVYAQTSREGFQQSLDISVYSLIGLVNKLLPFMRPSASVIALSYIGSQQAIPSYNVMGIAKAALESSVRYLARDCGEHGIRVNAISAGPIRTASAAGVKGMGDMLNQLSQTTPLKGCISTKQVGQVATFLASDLSSCITGEVIFADNGYHMMGGACLQ